MERIKNNLLIACSLILVTILFSCTAPRSITQSGKVTPHKYFKVGGDYLFNFSTAPVSSAYKNIEGVVTELIKKDSIILDEKIYDVNKTLVAYALDPINSGYAISLRYGVFKRWDVGYKWASGVHVFDTRYQFLGPTGNFKEPQEGKIFGSIGVQYSQQSFDVPIKYLDKIQQLLGFEFKRKDILFPLAFSVPFGIDEKFGNFSFGAVYSHTFVNYSFDPKNIYQKIDDNVPEYIPSLKGKQNFGSIGIFTNFKLGYKFVHVLPALAIYYQNYGTYHVIGGDAHFKGFTVVPSIGVVFNFTPFKNKNKVKSEEKSTTS